MSAITQAELDQLVVGALDENPITCGTVTRLLNASGIDVRRSAVERSLIRLFEQKRVGYVMGQCERNGFMVNGRHWYDAVAHAPEPRERKQAHTERTDHMDYVLVQKGPNHVGLCRECGDLVDIRQV